MSITAKVKYLKSVFRFFAVITASIASVLGNNMEDGSPTSFKQILRYSPLLPQLIDPFPPQGKTLSLKSSHSFWNGRFLDATNKLNKIKQDDEFGIVEGTLIMYHRFGQNDLQIPAVMTLDWYRTRALEENSYEYFKNSFIENIIDIDNTGYTGGNLTLFKGQMANIPVELSVNGNISFNGNLRFEEKDLIATNQKDDKNWTLEIEQTQNFNIMGNIGDRFIIDIQQDSEADFSWENDFNIEYRGQENEILKKVEAGNINLNMAGMDAVNMGGTNASLFGINATYELGPIAMQSVIGLEKVNKSEQTMTGGVSTSSGISKKDYEFIKDRYFFIDDTFRYNFYPLNADYIHSYDPNYNVGNYEVYQRVESNELDFFHAAAYVDPSSPTETYSVQGVWIKLEEYVDYEIHRQLGYLRLNTNSNNAIAIAYRIVSYNSSNNTFGQEETSVTYTDFKQTYNDCLTACGDINSPGYTACELACHDVVKLKLIKDDDGSTPSSYTWHLMFKNVYSLGMSNITPSDLEINIVRDMGGGLELTHSENGNSYLSIFDIDKKDQSDYAIDGGDGKIDLSPSIINYEHGELMLPAHLPFAYDPNFVWGNPHPDLNGILDEVNDDDGNFDDDSDGPDMYYTTGTSLTNEFLINVKTSSIQSSMDLDGFMIVEGSETVRLGNQVLLKGVDYEIDYFGGEIHFINENAMDPGAQITVSFEENQIFETSQKLLLGTYMNYEFGYNNYLAGGIFYYNESIAEKKVDIGYEPKRNIAWNIKGKYQNEWEALTRAVDFLPLIQTSKPSNFSLEGNYAEIIPNPNHLGQAFIDDFESSKQTASLSLMQRHWKMASPPDPTSESSSQTLKNRGRMFWYNPFEDIATQEIWPDQDVSTQANNSTTRILQLETKFSQEQVDGEAETLWNGIMIPLYAKNQSQRKYLDIWLYAEDTDPLVPLKFYIDIGYISEDWNGNGKLDTEDESINGVGDNILADGEDIGVDQCTNLYEDGWGGCLCDKYNDVIYDLTLSEINAQQESLCLYPVIEDRVTYTQALEDQNIGVNPYADALDPNDDNWCYSGGLNCDPSTDYYDDINGTEGNGQSSDFRYADTEDMDQDKVFDERNDYFTITIDPQKSQTDPSSMIETVTSKDWKLFRLPLSRFTKFGNVGWDNVQSLRLRVESDSTEPQYIKIAKIELVGNMWKEQGVVDRDNLYNSETLDTLETSDNFTVEVINTDESIAYNTSLNQINIVQEYDAYNSINMREQSLVLSFAYDANEETQSGLAGGEVGLIENPSVIGSNADPQSFKVYEKMEMYVHGGDPESKSSGCWYDSTAVTCDEDNVNILFRFGRYDHNDFYEIRQPIYPDWDSRNHLNIDIDKLTQIKIPILNSEPEILTDVGLDGFVSVNENGCVGYSETPYGGGFLQYTYDGIIDSLVESEQLTPSDTTGGPGFHHETFHIADGDSLMICGQLSWDELCGNCKPWDPNGDDYDNSGGYEGNGNYDYEDVDEDGDGEWDITEQLENDNGNGIYDAEGNYEYDDDLYLWTQASGISKACGNCTELRIKGEPAIDNIQSIVIGVVNNSETTIYGKVLVNELRMTGVKKGRESSYKIIGSLDFADLMTISGDYEHEDAGFHALQQRLGTGSAKDSYSARIELHPNIILPTRWGVNTPVTLYYNNTISTPKYHPGSDVLAETDDTNFNIEDIQNRNEQIGLSTSFSKSLRSTNRIIQNTIDNISLGFSSKKTNNSDDQIYKETILDYVVDGSYTFNWGEENYFSPFKFTKDWLILGNILSETRYYYSPDKFSSSIKFTENDKLTTQRNVINGILPDPVNTYSFDMHRTFTLHHKFTKALKTDYTRHIYSDMEKFRSDKWKIIKDMDPGRIKSISEQFSNTYSPDFIKWLNPVITFKPNYNWDLNTSDFKTANVQSSAIYRTTMGFKIQDFIELFYTPEDENKNDEKNNIQNRLTGLIFGNIHSLASKLQLKNIGSTYTYSTSHDYNNIQAGLSPSFLYRFGIQEFPLDGPGDLYDTTNANGSYAHSYSWDFKTNTNITIFRSISASLEYKYANSLSKSSVASTTENKSFSYYPLGDRGDKGIPIPGWGIQWSNIHKWWILNKLFQSVSLSHQFYGDYSVTCKDENGDGIVNCEKKDEDGDGKIDANEILNEQYGFHYSPIIGINARTKGTNPITIKASYDLSKIILNENKSTDQNYNNDMTVTISYEKSGGLKINTFFFRDFYIKNNMEFSLIFNYNTSRTLHTNDYELYEYNEEAKNIDWSLRPNVSYSFTNWVTGNFYMMYGVYEDKTSGRREERDFGFSMNIRIHG